MTAAGYPLTTCALNVTVPLTPDQARAERDDARAALMVQARGLWEDGLPMAEIADKLGVPVGTLKSWAHRGGWPARYALARAREQRASTLLGEVATRIRCWRCAAVTVEAPDRLRRCPACGAPPAWKTLTGAA